MRRAALLALVLLAAGCGSEEPAETRQEPAARTVDRIAAPSAPGSSAPHLEAAPDGALLMSWIEQKGDGSAAVRLARFRDGAWSDPVTVVERDDLFVNWADFPSVHAVDADSFVVHWLQKSGEGAYAYDVRLARTDDGGRTWSEPLTPHDDGTQTEHGFVSMDHREGSQSVHAVWLDGRHMTGGHDGHGGGDMTLRWAELDAAGGVVAGAQLDERTCECCQTAMAMTAEGPVVAYRDRSAEEIRDIAIVRLAGGSWTEPRVVHPDGWEIAGCPVNGPQLAARGSTVALAWFTAARGEPRVQVAFSRDAGASWSAPVRLDGGSAVGRVDVVMTGDDRAVVTWLEGAAEGAEIRSRIARADGTLGDPAVIGRTTAARAAGFPRSAVADGGVYHAWTESKDAPEIRIAREPLE